MEGKMSINLLMGVLLIIALIPASAVIGQEALGTIPARLMWLPADIRDDVIKESGATIDKFGNLVLKNGLIISSLDITKDNRQINVIMDISQNSYEMQRNLASFYSNAEWEKGKLTYSFDTSIDKDTLYYQLADDMINKWSIAQPISFGGVQSMREKPADERLI